jgi:hypothetical protein
VSIIGPYSEASNALCLGGLPLCLGKLIDQLSFFNLYRQALLNSVLNEELATPFGEANSTPGVHPVMGRPVAV